MYLFTLSTKQFLVAQIRKAKIQYSFFNFLPLFLNSYFSFEIFTLVFFSLWINKANKGMYISFLYHRTCYTLHDLTYKSSYLMPLFRIS